MEVTGSEKSAREIKAEFMANTTCGICQEPPWIDPVTTKCGHIFCQGCLYTWFGNKLKTCPICRTLLRFFKLGDIEPIFFNDSHTLGYASYDGMIADLDDEEGNALLEVTSRRLASLSLYVTDIFKV